MKCASRHTRRGVDGEEEYEKPAEITTYEVARNIRIKALHDEVQKALVDSDFGEAAIVRALFPGVSTATEGIGVTNHKVTTARRRSITGERDVQVRRSAHNVRQENSKTEENPTSRQLNNRVRHTFCVCFLVNACIMVPFF